MRAPVHNRIGQNPEEPARGVDEPVQPVRVSSRHEALVDLVQEAVSQDDGRGQEEGSQGVHPVHVRSDHPCREQAQGEELTEVEKKVRAASGWVRRER